MKNYKNIFALFIGFLFVQFSIASDLIEAKEMAKIMKDKNVIVVSAQKASLYSDFHITGSINLPPAKLTNNEPIPYINKSVAEMEKIIGSKGISETNTIIVYDEGSSKYSGRLYWVFKYLGVANVKILNGGIEAWKVNRKPVTASPTTLKATTFKANVQPQFIASLDEVKKASTSDSYVIIDARSTAEYEGTDETDLRKGHIPSAVHIEYKDIIATNGTLKSPEALKALYESKGVTANKTVIIYCKTSVRAAIEYAALYSVLGYPNVKVFDGAMCEWCSDKSTDVVRN